MLIPNWDKVPVRILSRTKEVYLKMKTCLTKGRKNSREQKEKEKWQERMEEMFLKKNLLRRYGSQSNQMINIFRE